jgi:hypothetical protein
MLRSTGERQVRRVRLRRAVERGLCDHDQPYICAASDDGGPLPCLFRGALGNEGVCSVGSWEGTLVLSLGMWYREWEEKAPRTMEFELCSLHVAPSNGTNLCIYVLYYVLCHISSLCSGGFADATACMCWFGVWWGHGTDVTRTGCAQMGSATRHVSFYASLVGGGLRLSRPSSGSNSSVRVYRRVIFG